MEAPPLFETSRVAALVILLALATLAPHTPAPVLKYDG
jgi:hypothetical protein